MKRKLSLLSAHVLFILFGFCRQFDLTQKYKDHLILSDLSISLENWSLFPREEMHPSKSEAEYFHQSPGIPFIFALSSQHLVGLLSTNHMLKGNPRWNILLIAIFVNVFSVYPHR